ncbi:MAG TPA: RtcB family protein, partial [Pirellulales bacterium]
MNKRQLLALGVPQETIKEAIAGIKSAKLARAFPGRKPEDVIKEIMENPALYSADPHYSLFVQALVADDEIADPTEPVVFRQWGEDIDTNTRNQMREACELPVARAGALMPDAHVGYGLPIGGVLATENAVVPYAVGVDIACRMKLSITDLPVQRLKKQPDSFDASLIEGTRFGVGANWSKPKDHPVLDADWDSLKHTRELKDLARKQLGTSGSGNHFVEWGFVTLPKPDLGLEAGTYVALLSHSGSRG